MDIPDHLSPQDIVEESSEWGERLGVIVEKYDKASERPRPASIRVTVHLKNIPLRIWLTATVRRIMEDFGDPVVIDVSTTDEPDKRAVYGVVDCHDPR
jgi:hypothetical protein